MAVICGTPAPVTTRVVQMDPGPIPTLIPSTPARANSHAPSNVATLPAISSTSGSLDLITLMASSTRVEWPWALSRSEEHTSELQSQSNLVCRLLLEKKKKTKKTVA